MSTENTTRPMTSLLRHIQQAPKTCVYSLVEPVQKRVQVFSTSDFLSHLIGVLGRVSDYGDMKLHLETIELVIESTTETSTQDLKLAKERAIARYRDMGYVEYKTSYNTKYKLVTSTVYKDNKLVFKLDIETSNGTVITLGHFTSKRSLNEFMTTHYPNNTVYKIVKKNEQSE